MAYLYDVVMPRANIHSALLPQQHPHTPCIHTHPHTQPHPIQPGGVLYLNWYPVWTGPRGHHIHPGMVKEWEAKLGCVTSSGYRNDGSVIPDWGHVLYNVTQFTAILVNSSMARCPGLVEKVVEYVMQHDDLNKMTYSQVMRLIYEELPQMQLVLATNLQTDEGAVLTDEMAARLRQRYPKEEHFALGEVVLVLEKQGGFVARA